MYYPHIVLDLLWVGCNSHLKKVKGKSESRYQPHLIQGLPKNILRFGYLTFQVKLFHNKYYGSLVMLIDCAPWIYSQQFVD